MGKSECCWGPAMSTELTQDEQGVQRQRETVNGMLIPLVTGGGCYMMTKKYRAEITNHRLRGQNGPITRFHLAGTGFVTFFYEKLLPIV